MRRELQWEATVARLQQQLTQLKGEGDHKAAEDAAEGQAKQLNSIRSCAPTSHLPLKHHHCCTPVTVEPGCDVHHCCCGLSCVDWPPLPS